MLETETILHDWTEEIATPLRLVENVVKPEWIDEYGHLNMAHYLTICDQANWAFWNWLNFPENSIEARGGAEYVIVENHVTYTGELAQGDAFVIETQLLAVDGKRYVLFHRVLNEAGDCCATNEVKVLGFDLNARRACVWQTRTADRLQAILEAHSDLPTPAEAGRSIQL
ncbi:MAG: thioesterase family protein [Pelagimonas sp.]|jgi:YbgC/YbaW family acyl-CoA thioester hydrolase|nr:thioesterase family protein [Pelagimonas sp.]